MTSSRDPADSDPPASRSPRQGLRPVPRLGLELLILISVAAVAGYALLQVTVVVIPVLFGLLLTALLRPSFRLVRRTRLPAGLSALLVIAGFLGLLGVLVAIVIPQFADQAGQLSSTLSKGVGQVSKLVENLPFGIAESDVRRALDGARSGLSDHLGTIGQGVLSGALAAGNVLTQAVLSVVVAFFFLYDGGRMWSWLTSLAPSRYHADATELGPLLWETLERYVQSIVIVAFVDAVFIGLGAAIIGVPLVIPIAVLTFLGGFIPIVGATLAGAVAVLIGLVAGGATDALIMLGVVLLVQQLEGNVLQPFIVGRSLSLHPLVTLLVVAAGASLGGILGALFAVPVTAVIWRVVSFYRERATPVTT